MRAAIILLLIIIVSVVFIKLEHFLPDVDYDNPQQAMGFVPGIVRPVSEAEVMMVQQQMMFKKYIEARQKILKARRARRRAGNTSQTTTTLPTVEAFHESSSDSDSDDEGGHGGANMTVNLSMNFEGNGALQYPAAASYQYQGGEGVVGIDDVGGLLQSEPDVYAPTTTATPTVQPQSASPTPTSTIASFPATLTPLPPSTPEPKQPFDDPPNLDDTNNIGINPSKNQPTPTSPVPQTTLGPGAGTATTTTLGPTSAPNTTFDSTTASPSTPSPVVDDVVIHDAPSGNSGDFADTNLYRPPTQVDSVDNVIESSPVIYRSTPAEIIAMVDAINNERLCAKNGAGPLELDDDLAKAAKMHSETLVSVGYNKSNPHIGVDGTEPWDRVSMALGKVFTLYYYKVSENLSIMFSDADLTDDEKNEVWKPKIEAVIYGWMCSPDHKNNQLDPYWTHVGVAYAEGTREKFKGVWTVVFGQKKDVALEGFPEGAEGSCRLYRCT